MYFGIVVCTHTALVIDFATWQRNRCKCCFEKMVARGKPSEWRRTTFQSDAELDNGNNTFNNLPYNCIQETIPVKPHNWSNFSVSREAL